MASRCIGSLDGYLEFSRERNLGQFKPSVQNGKLARGLNRSIHEWMDGACVMDRCQSLDGPRERKKRTFKSVSRISFSQTRLQNQCAMIDDVIVRLKMARREMEDGIQTMVSQISKIQFCSEANQKQTHKRMLDTHSPTEFNDALANKHPSGCIPIGRDLIFESSTSEIDSLAEYGHTTPKADFPEDASCSVTPIHTPNLMETCQTVISRNMTSINNELGTNNEIEVTMHLAEENTFRTARSRLFSGDHELEDEIQSLEDMLGSVRERPPLTPRTNVYPCRGMKTDIVLNLQPMKEMQNVDLTKAKMKKRPTMEKLIGIFRKKRRAPKSFAGSMPLDPPLMVTHSEKGGKRLGRWRRHWSSGKRGRFLANSSSCKFTDKYPIGQDMDSRNFMLQCFSRSFKSEKVCLECNDTLAASNENQRSFVMSADGIANGIACFDVICHQLSGWCFVGVASKPNAVSWNGAISNNEMSYGWSNKGDGFREGVQHAIPHKEPFKTGTNFQVCLPLLYAKRSFCF